MPLLLRGLDGWLQSSRLIGDVLRSKRQADRDRQWVETEYLEADGSSSTVQQLHDQGYTKVLGMVCDVSKDSDQHNLIQATVDQFGGIDILVCNAAVAFGGPVTQISDSKWDKAFQVNVKSTFILTKAVLPYMKKRNGSNIVLISSIWGYNPSPMAGTYGVTKTTLFGMTSELSQELGQFNIRVNCVAPGVIETAMSTLLRQGGDENPA